MRNFTQAEVEGVQIVTLKLYHIIEKEGWLSQLETFDLLRQLGLDFEKEYQEYFETHPDADWQILCDRFCERTRREYKDMF